MTGSEFRAWRRAQGWSVEQTAAALGISASTVYNHERADAVPVAIALALDALSRPVMEKTAAG